MSGRERDEWCPHEARRHALTCGRRCACCGAPRCPPGPGADMEEGGYWRPSCSSLSLADPHGSTQHLCARHAQHVQHTVHAPAPRAHRLPHTHAHGAHSHPHHHLQHAQSQHSACPVHSPFRQPTPEYCAAHSQVHVNILVCQCSPKIKDYA